MCGANNGVTSRNTSNACRNGTGAAFHPLSRYSAETAEAAAISTSAGTHHPSPLNSGANRGRAVTMHNNVADGISALTAGPP